MRIGDGLDSAETVRATAVVDEDCFRVEWVYDQPVALGVDDEMESPPFFGVKTGDTVELRIIRRPGAQQG